MPLSHALHICTSLHAIGFTQSAMKFLQKRHTLGAQGCGRQKIETPHRRPRQSHRTLPTRNPDTIARHQHLRHLPVIKNRQALVTKLTLEYH
jgi:hypothetical protein